MRRTARQRVTRGYRRRTLVSVLEQKHGLCTVPRVQPLFIAWTMLALKRISR
jgi:hypothetical protein